VEYFLPAGLREAQAAGIKFTHRSKIRFFAPQGRLVAPIHVKLGVADGHVGPFGCAKFHLNRFRGGNPAPKSQKFQLFGKGSPPVGKTLDRFLNVLGNFMRTIITQTRCKFHVIRFTGYGVIAEKPRAGHLGRIFLCTL